MDVFLVADDYEFPHFICATLDLAMALEEKRRPLTGRETRWDARRYSDETPVWRRQEFGKPPYVADGAPPKWIDLDTQIEKHEIRGS